MTKYDEKIQNNKYYTGGDSVLNNNWGFPTEAEAIEKATQKLTEDPTKQQIFVVRIVKVVKRTNAPVTIENVK